jgi:hypothetical protein
MELQTAVSFTQKPEVRDPFRTFCPEIGFRDGDAMGIRLVSPRKELCRLHQNAGLLSSRLSWR